MTEQEYTPTTEEVRERYAAARYYLDNEDHLTESGREFNRWLAGVIQKAKDEACEDMSHNLGY